MAPPPLQDGGLCRLSPSLLAVCIVCRFCFGGSPRSFGLAQPSPLPLQGRFSEDFIERRRRALERFTNRLARHPVVRYSNLLTHFLSCTDDSVGNWGVL